MHHFSFSDCARCSNICKLLTFSETVFASKSSINASLSCLTYFPRGFCYAIDDTLYIYHKDVNNDMLFTRKTIYTVPENLYGSATNRIISVSLNVAKDSILIHAEHSRLFVASLNANVASSSDDAIPLMPLGEQLHAGAIIDMAVCPWMSIVMSGAEDQTVRLWDYKSGRLQMLQKFHTDFLSLDLHPSGLFAAIGFVDQLRVFAIQLNEMEIIRTFNYSECNVLKYSVMGHLLACACINEIIIISMFTFDLKCILKVCMFFISFYVNIICLLFL